MNNCGFYQGVVTDMCEKGTFFFSQDEGESSRGFERCRQGHEWSDEDEGSGKGLEEGGHWWPNRPNEIKASCQV